MILVTHYDPSYLNESHPRSRAGSHIFLSKDCPILSLNGAILTLSQINKCIMSSVAESKLVALFVTAKNMVSLHQSLIEMGWPQPKSSIQTDNSTGVGVTNNIIVSKSTKLINTCLY